MNNNFSMVTEPESIGQNMVIGVAGLIEVHGKVYAVDWNWFADCVRTGALKKLN